MGLGGWGWTWVESEHELLHFSNLIICAFLQLAREHIVRTPALFEEFLKCVGNHDSIGQP